MAFLTKWWLYEEVKVCLRPRMNFAFSKYTLLIKPTVRCFSLMFLPSCNIVWFGLSSFVLSVNQVITADLLRLPGHAWWKLLDSPSLWRHEGTSCSCTFIPLPSLLAPSALYSQMMKPLIDLPGSLQGWGSVERSMLDIKLDIKRGAGPIS